VHDIGVEASVAFGHGAMLGEGLPERGEQAA